MDIVLGIETLFETKQHLEREILMDETRIDDYKCRPDSSFNMFSREELIQEVQQSLNKNKQKLKEFLERNKE